MIGTGYVGLVTGTCFSELGHTVICVDKDKSKIDTLNAGEIPIYEPGLDQLVKKNKKKGRLRFTTSIQEGVQSSEIVFIAVNTPPTQNGEADLSFVEACTREVAAHVKKYTLLVEKSTVPVQTGERIQKTLSVMNVPSTSIEVASNPEFLREGSAVEDFLKPDRVVLGVGSERAERLLRDLYKKVKAPVVVTDIKSAELIKHASNSFLALKISYINSIARICDKVGADVVKVAEGMGLDARIGRSFLNAGIGYGGSCFPKDVSAFIKIAEKTGFDFKMLKATQEINNDQKSLLLKTLEEELWTLKGKSIGIWGLSFKPNTDDLRNAPALEILSYLLEAGAAVKAFDPVSNEKMKAFFPQVTYTNGPLEAIQDADALVLLTEWDIFKHADPKKIKKSLRIPLIIDGRNMWDPNKMRAMGFHYHGVGRGLPLL